MTNKPLDGVRVVDFTHVLAGPYCTMLLADAGAEVIKVEPPGGEFARERGTRAEPAEGEWVSAYYVAVNRGKRSLVADLKSPEGKRAVSELIASADVVVENFSPGTMARLGFDLTQLRADRPELITVSMSLYGAASEQMNFEGHPRLGLAIVAEAETAVMSSVHDPDALPSTISFAAGDMVTGLSAYAAITTALAGRHACGEGRHIDISMVQSLLSMTAPAMVTHEMLGTDPDSDDLRNELRQATTAPYGFYRCEDGLVAIAVNNDRTWRSLIVALGREDLADDPRYSFRDERNPRADEVRQIVEQQTLKMKKRDVLALMVRNRVPGGLVRRPWELHRDPDFEAIGSYELVDDGFGNRYRTPANPFGLRSESASVPRLNDFERP